MLKVIKGQSQSKLDENKENGKGEMVTIQDIWLLQQPNGQQFNLLLSSITGLQSQTLNNGKGLVFKLVDLRRIYKEEFDSAKEAEKTIIHNHVVKDATGKPTMKDIFQKDKDGSMPLKDGKQIKIGEEFTYENDEEKRAIDNEFQELLKTPLKKLTGVLNISDFDGLENIAGISGLISGLGNVVK